MRDGCTNSGGRARPWLALVSAMLLVSVASAGAAWAQADPGRLTVRSDGFIFWVQGGYRQVVYPASLPDQQIGALPEGIPLDASLQPRESGTETGQLVMRSDGFLFWIRDGQRHVVYPAPFTDEQINALPESIPLDASLTPASPPASVAAGAAPAGTSRADRLLPGQPCLCSRVRPNGQLSELRIRLLSFEPDAWDRIRSQHNPLNQPPREGSIYVVTRLNINYAAGPRDLPVSIDRFDFIVIDGNNTVYVPAFVVETDQLATVTAFPGADIAGSIAFMVPAEQANNLVLVWNFNDDNPVWFGLPTQ